MLNIVNHKKKPASQTKPALKTYLNEKNYSSIAG